MKRKILIILLALATVFCCAFGLTACGGGGVEGTYYLYSNEQLDKTQFITLKGGKWSDDDDESGTYKLDGSTITFYVSFFGSEEELYSGTVSDGVLQIKVFGANMTYCKEGSEPSDGNNPSNNTKPSTTQYTVTYDANGGAFSDGSTTMTQTVNEGSTLTAPNSPTRTASAFGGWSTSKNGSTLWKFASDTVTGNLTLYAVWVEQSAAIISADGATIDEQKMSVFMLVDRNTESVSLSNKIVCSSDSVWKLYYDKLGQTEIPTKIAAGKLGELSSGDNIFYIVVTSSNASQVNVYELTVHRSYAITVSYYNNKSELIKTDTAYSGYEYSVNYTPNISGYSFNYWKNSSGNKVTSITSYEPFNLYADCTANTFTATLNVNGGDEVETTEYTITYDKSFTLAVPTRTGYTFAGWYVGTTQLTNAKGASLENWTYTRSQTLTAKWTAKSYTVTLNRNDTEAGTVTGSGSKDYDSNVTISATTNNGYTWLGWYDKDEELVTANLNYTFKVSGAISFTAKWIACPVTLEKSMEGAGTITYTAATVAGQNYTATAKTNSGYTWLGWYKGDELLTNEFTYSYSMPSTADNAVTYTAKWIVCTVSIQSSNTTAGTVSGLPSTTVAGQEISLTANSKNLLGYTWLGWYNGEEKYTDEYSFDFTIPSTDDIIYNFIANWRLDEKLENFNFTLTSTACTITGVKDKSVTEVVVPDYVTSISKGAFSGCSNLESITLPFVGGSKTATTASSSTLFGYIFGNASFTGSYSARQYYATSSYINYYIPSSLKNVTVTGGNILYGAFSGCSGLTEIIIPDSVTEIGEGAFSGCSGLTEIIIPDSVTEIGTFAFSRCRGLTEITIPDSVTSIGWYAFYGCSGLTSVTIPDSVTTIGDSAFGECTGLTEIIIPDSVTTIGDSAFSGCSVLTSVTIPDSVTSIGDSAFSGCSVLTSMTIPDSVTSIGSNAFSGCSGLTSITIPNSVTSIGSGAFSGCSGLTEIIIPDNVTEIGAFAFSGCSGLTEIIIPDNVIEIGIFAFSRCRGLTEITIPDSVTTIGDSAFGGCTGLTSVTIGNNVTTIGKDAFSGCSGLTSATITTIAINYIPKDNLKNVRITSGDTISNSAFYGCSGLTSVTLPDSVTSIGEDAFSGCSGLTSITIPNSVTSIGYRAFIGCSGLTEINFSGTKAQWNAISKGGIWNYNTGSYTIYCTDGTISKS